MDLWMPFSYMDLRMSSPSLENFAGLAVVDSFSHSHRLLELLRRSCSQAPRLSPATSSRPYLHSGRLSSGPRDTSLLGSEGVFSVATRRRMANTKRKLRFPMQVLCLLILLYYLWTPFISHDEKGLEDLNQSRVCVLIPISTRSIRAHKTIEHLKWLSPQIGI